MAEVADTTGILYDAPPLPFEVFVVVAGVDEPSLPIERSVASRWLWAEERDTRDFPVF